MTILFWTGSLCALLGLLIPKGKGGRLFFWTAFMCIGVLRWETALWERQVLDRAFGGEKETWVQGTVATDPQPSSYGRQSFLLKVAVSRGASPPRANLNVLAPDGLRVRYGDRLVAKGLFSPFPSRRNPGGFDWRFYFQGRCVYGTFHIRDLDPVLKEKARILSLPKQALFAWKRSLLQKIRRQLSPQEASFLGALLLGDRTRINPELWDLLSKIGVVHLIAISGLHVGMVATCCFFFLKTLRFSRRASLIGTLFLLWLFVELVGEAPPILRSSLMVAVYLIGRLLWRRSHPFHALSASFLILVWTNPFYLFEAGFQLSFLSVFTILLFVPSSENPPSLKGPLGFLVQSFRVSAAVWLGLLPVIAWHFHLVSPIALLANLFAIPHSLFLVVLGLVWFSFGSWVPFLSEVLLTILSITTSVGLKVFHLFEKIPFGFFHVGRPSLLFLLFYYLFLLAWVLAPRLRFKRMGVLLSAFLFLNLWIWGSLWKPREQLLRVTFLDVGHGDAILCEFPRGGTLLIDGGRRDDTFDAGREIIAGALWVKGIERLDAVVLTHSDGDHVGGLPTVLRQFRPRALFETGVSQPSRLYRAYRACARDMGLTPTILERGQRLQGIPEVLLDVLHPPRPLLEGTGRDENNNGLVLKLRYGKISFLFAADLEEEGIQSLLHSGQDLSSQILKFPHHGGRLDNGRSFLRAAGPRIAVISVGPYRQYRLPAPETLSQLADSGVEILKTVERGAVGITSDGSSCEIF